MVWCNIFSVAGPAEQCSGGQKKAKYSVCVATSKQGHSLNSVPLIPFLLSVPPTNETFLLQIFPLNNKTCRWLNTDTGGTSQEHRNKRSQTNWTGGSTAISIRLSHLLNGYFHCLLQCLKKRLCCHDWILNWTHNSKNTSNFELKITLKEENVRLQKNQ